MGKSNKQIIVLGVMRSGTSLASGMLSKMGVDMGVDRKNPDKNNPNGYFEDREIFNLNRMILTRAGGENWQPVEINEDLFLLFAGDFKEIGERKGVWGCKGGMNLTLDGYMPYLSNPYLVIVYRNPISNIRSLRNYRDIGFEPAMKLVLRYYQEFLKIITKYPEVPKYYFEFERAKKEPLKIAEELADFMGIELKNKQAIKDFVYVQRH